MPPPGRFDTSDKLLYLLLNEWEYFLESSLSTWWNTLILTLGFLYYRLKKEKKKKKEYAALHGDILTPEGCKDVTDKWLHDSQQCPTRYTQSHLPKLATSLRTSFPPSLLHYLEPTCRGPEDKPLFGCNYQIQLQKLNTFYNSDRCILLITCRCLEVFIRRKAARICLFWVITLELEGLSNCPNPTISLLPREAWFQCSKLWALMKPSTVNIFQCWSGEVCLPDRCWINMQ